MSATSDLLGAREVITSIVLFQSHAAVWTLFGIRLEPSYCVLRWWARSTRMTDVATFGAVLVSTDATNRSVLGRVSPEHHASMSALAALDAGHNVSRIESHALVDFLGTLKHLSDHQTRQSALELLVAVQTGAHRTLDAVNGANVVRLDNVVKQALVAHGMIAVTLDNMLLSVRR